MNVFHDRSMKEIKCMVCKFKNGSSNVVYDGKGNAINLHLCYTHSVDLFKIGQISFIKKYKGVFSASLNPETQGLVGLLPPGH